MSGWCASTYHVRFLSIKHKRRNVFCLEIVKKQKKQIRFETSTKEEQYYKHSSRTVLIIKRAASCQYKLDMDLCFHFNISLERALAVAFRRAAVQSGFAVMDATEQLSDHRTFLVQTLIFHQY